MSSIEVKKINKHSVKVVLSSNQKEFISPQDAEMDARAARAVCSAVEKAKFCNKPVAKYDSKSKRAYIEYPNGEKKYVE